MENEQKIPVIPVVSGEVFLKDKIIDEEHCYICNKYIDKFNAKDAVLLRIAEGIMGFCCADHKGVVQEFIKQFKRLPYGWEKHNETIKDITGDVGNIHTTNKYRKRQGKTRKAKKRRF